METRTSDSKCSETSVKKNEKHMQSDDFGRTYARRRKTTHC